MNRIPRPWRKEGIVRKEPGVRGQATIPTVAPGET